MVTGIQLIMFEATDSLRCPHCESLCWLPDRSGDPAGVRCGQCSRKPGEIEIYKTAMIEKELREQDWSKQFAAARQNIARDRNGRTRR